MELFYIKYETKDGSNIIHNAEFVNGSGYHLLSEDVMKFTSKEDAHGFMKTWKTHPFGHIDKHKLQSFEVIPLPREFWDGNDWKSYALELESKIGVK